MSLTSNLSNPTSVVSLFMRKQFPQTSQVLANWQQQLRDVPITQPHRAVPWPLIGTAIDYRLRYYFDGFSSDCGGANSVVMNLSINAAHSRNDPELLLQARTAGARAKAFFSHLEAFVLSRRPAGRLLDATDEALLNRYCLVLADWQMAARNPNYAEASPFPPLPRWSEAWDTDPTPLLTLAKPRWVRDLCEMSRGFFEQRQDLLRGRVVLNPVFGGSRTIEVGGAEGDLIVDGCLIEIKATTRPQPQGEFLYQLLGYVLLDYDDEFHIDAIGVYLARQRTLLRWPLSALLPMATGRGQVSLTELRSAFWDGPVAYAALHGGVG